MFATKGWRRFSYDPSIAAWAQEALGQAKEVVQQPEMRKKWLQCQGTWFVGVDALASDGQGALGGVPLAGDVIKWLSDMDYLPISSGAVIGDLSRLSKTPHGRNRGRI